MQLNTGQWVVIGICAVLIAGYIGGYYVNRRMAEQVVIWLHTGLKRWGQLTAGGRLGGMATGGRLYVKNANASFQNIEVVFWLAPRENVLFWLYDLLRGRQDVLILKISLRVPPKKETLVEAGRPRDRDFKEALDRANMPTVESTAGGLVFVQGSKGSAAGERARLFLEQYGGLVARLSVGRKSPHVTIQMRLKPLLTQSTEDFFSALNELCTE